MSENCQENDNDTFQAQFTNQLCFTACYKSVRNVSEKPFDSFMTLLRTKNVSQLSIKVSEMCLKKPFDSFLTHFWYKCFLKMFHHFLKMFHNLNVNVSEICQLISLWQIYDTFTSPTLTVFWPIYDFRHFSDAFTNLVRHISDRICHLTEFWQISDTF